MSDATDTMGERAATTAEVAQWVTLVRSGRSGSHGWKKPAGKDARKDDAMRPSDGSSTPTST